MNDNRMQQFYPEVPPVPEVPMADPARGCYAALCRAVEALFLTAEGTVGREAAQDSLEREARALGLFTGTPDPPGVTLMARPRAPRILRMSRGDLRAGGMTEVEIGWEGPAP